MKRLFTIIILLNYTVVFAQQESWTWLKGSDVAVAGSWPGRYGVKGIAAPENCPGARINPITWKDNSGNFWVFGGWGFAQTVIGNLNDLWRYNIAANEWTWISGDSTINNTGVYGTKAIADPANKPGGRSAGTGWCDNNGRFWIYAGALNATPWLFSDLWMYDPVANVWTWMNGENISANVASVYGTLGITSAANRPGSRIYGAGWSDDIGNLYLYGGAGAATSATLGGLSDLWKYSTLTNQWTWIHGTNAFSSQAIRGTRGIAAATNRPAYKSQAAYCKDFQGNFWLFGGYTYDQATSTPGESNDLWKYDPVTNEWTWVAGETFINAYAVYGNKGFPSPANRPAAKSSAVGWADIDGNFWVFGGYGFSQTIQGYVNDLWKYEKDLDQWTWVKGDSTVDTQGNFGVQGVASTLNTPGTKQYARGWTDAVGNFYLFAGSGTASGGTGGYMNDLWKFGPTHTLPVQLVSFYGKRSRAMSTLQWEVEQESNLDRYEVERSFSGNNFDYAGSVKAKGAKSYRYDDRATIFQSRIFYRLKIIDSDNQFRYSKVIALDISPEVSISVYPNPVRSALCVQMNRYIVGTTHITITDAMGRVVFVKEYSGTGNDEQQLWIPVQTWPAGLYSLRIKNNYNEYPLSFVVGAN